MVGWDGESEIGLRHFACDLIDNIRQPRLFSRSEISSLFFIGQDKL